MPIPRSPAARFRVPLLPRWLVTGLRASFAVPAAEAQTPLPRDSAAFSDVSGHTSDAVFETTLAVGEDRVMSVFHVAPYSSSYGLFEIGYAIATRDPNDVWTWADEGIIDEGSFTSDPNDMGLADPSVAYDSVTGDFLVCALDRSQTRIVLARFDASASPPQFGPWVPLGAPGSGYDKPWIVAGDVVPGPPVEGFGEVDPIMFQEFYVTWDGDGRLNYLRSTDGGFNWEGGDALTDLDDPNSVIPATFLPAPRVHDDRPLYVAFEGFGELSADFVRGNDVNSGAHAGEVEFTRLIDPNAAPLTVPFNMPRSALSFLTPRQSISFGARGPGFDLATDPTDAGRLFFVYHDTAAPPFDPNNNLVDADVNVYLRILTRVSGATWMVGERIPVVAGGVTTFESDQFLPAIDVDSDGGIHVIFYDDRNYTDPTDPNQPNQDQQPDGEFYPRFDVWYAYSNSGGASWTYSELCDNPESNCEGTDPAVRFENPDSSPGFTLKDYIGIDIRGDRVWTSFMGHSDADLNANDSIIWSSQILLP